MPSRRDVRAYLLLLAGLLLAIGILAHLVYFYQARTPGEEAARTMGASLLFAAAATGVGLWFGSGRRGAPFAAVVLFLVVVSLQYWLVVTVPVTLALFVATALRAPSEPPPSAATPTG